MANIVLKQSANRPECEEREADRFALDYLYAAMDPLLSVPRKLLPLDSTWPNVLDDPSHPTKRSRQDQVTVALAFKNAAVKAAQRPFGPPPDKLSVPGAVVGDTVLDADLWESNISLDWFVQGGTRCIASR
jgi:hypothetical protein